MTQPSTGFELTGSWTTLDQETAFLQQVAAETGAVLTVAGYTAGATPRTIWAIEIGTPALGTLLVTTLIHAAEPATRESALAWFRDLAYSTAPDVVAYLAQHRVVLVTPCNGGAFSPGPAGGGRFNPNNVNINRDMLQLTQPESQAIARAVATFRPHLMVDVHERDARSSGSESIQYGSSELPEMGTEVRALGAALGEHIRSAFTGAGLTAAPYQWAGIGAAQGALSVMACAWHAVSLLSETTLGDTAYNRVSYTRRTLDNVWPWHSANAAALMAAQAASRAEATRSRAKVQVCSRPATVLGGPKVSVAGYQLTAPLPALHREVFDIVESGGYVSVGQPARWVIPHLLDPQSNDAVVAADRVAGPERFRGNVSGFRSGRGRVTGLRTRIGDRVFDVG